MRRAILPFDFSFYWLSLPSLLPFKMLTDSLSPYLEPAKRRPASAGGRVVLNRPSKANGGVSVPQHRPPPRPPPRTAPASTHRAPPPPPPGSMVIGQRPEWNSSTKTYYGAMTSKENSAAMHARIREDAK